MTNSRDIQPKNTASESGSSTSTDDSSDEVLEALLELNPLPLIVVDPVIFRILEVNEAALEQYGYAREEFIGLMVWEICPREMILEGEELGIESANDLQGAKRQRRKDGSYFETLVTVREIRFRGADSVVLLVDDRGKWANVRAELALAPLGHQLAAAADPVEFRDRRL